MSNLPTPAGDTRSRTLSSQQALFLSELSKKGLNWHVNKPAEPNLTFLLHSVGVVASDKILLAISFVDKDKAKDKQKDNVKDKEKEGSVMLSGSRIDMVEKEHVRKSIQLENIVKVRRSRSNPCMVEIVYMLDKTNVDAHHSNSGKTPSSSTSASSPASPAKAKAFLLSVCFASLRDASDAFLILQQMALRTFTGFSFGQVCFHKGYVEKTRKSKVSWAKRYLRLFSNRLLIFRSHDSPFPVNVICLSGVPSLNNKLTNDYERIEAVKVSAGADGRSFSIEQSSVSSASGSAKKAVFRTETTKDMQMWLTALQAEQDPRFDQPISALQAKEGAMVAAAPEPSPADSPTRSVSPSVWQKKQTDHEHAGQVLALAKMHYNQPRYFSLIAKIRENKIIFSSDVYTGEEWAKVTPQKFFSSRGKLIKEIDDALHAYHIFIQSANEVLKTCRVVCTELGSVSSASQIGFSFPGMDTQVFDVGRIGVVAPWQFFAGAGSLSFQKADWDGAMNSNCVAKELMQTSPDVSSLFELKRNDEAKSIMKSAQEQVLHNICLAAYFRAHGMSDDRKIKLTPGDVLSWANVLAQFDEGLNRVLMEAWAHLAYVFNPDREVVEQLISIEASNLNLTARSEADSTTSPSSSSSSTSSSSTSSSSAASSFASSSSLSSPSTSSNPGSNAGSDQRALNRLHMRVLVEPLWFLALLRQLMEKRVALLQPISQCCGNWLDKKAKLKNDKELAERYAAVESLKHRVDMDFTSLADILTLLPKDEVVEEALRIKPRSTSDRESIDLGAELFDDEKEPHSPLFPASASASSSLLGLGDNFSHPKGSSKIRMNMPTRTAPVKLGEASSSLQVSISPASSSSSSSTPTSSSTANPVLPASSSSGNGNLSTVVIANLNNGAFASSRRTPSPRAASPKPVTCTPSSLSPPDSPATPPPELSFDAVAPVSSAPVETAEPASLTDSIVSSPTDSVASSSSSIPAEETPQAPLEEKEVEVSPELQKPQSDEAEKTEAAEEQAESAAAAAVVADAASDEEVISSSE